jgi:hypothetical protein
VNGWIARLQAVATALLAAAGSALAAPEGLSEGDVVHLAGRELTVKEMDVTPVVRNEFTERYTALDCFDNAELKQLRRQERLDEVLAAGKGEFDKQVLLMDWTYRRFKLFGQPKSRPVSVVEILKLVDEGQAFSCGQYATVLRSALASCGWVARSTGLKGAKSDGNGTEHGIVEVWSNKHRKWVVLDPTLNIYFERGDLPLNAFEIRQEWFYNEGKDLAIIVGAERERHMVSDLPIKRGTHKGFGTLYIKRESIGKFLYIAYTPRRPDGRPDWGKMFIIKDKLCEGVEYHTRTNPKDPAHEPYWPMQQAALTLKGGEGMQIEVAVDTFTPDFAGYCHRVDGGQWHDGVPTAWVLHEGENALDVIAVNKFGIEGVPSRAVLELK